MRCAYVRYFNLCPKSLNVKTGQFASILGMDWEEREGEGRGEGGRGGAGRVGGVWWGGGGDNITYISICIVITNLNDRGLVWRLLFGKLGKIFEKFSV